MNGYREPFLIQVAGFVFEITCRYPNTQAQCRDYLVDDDLFIHLRICPTKEDIDYEDKKSVREATYEGLSPIRYTSGYLESISVYRHIAEWLSFQTDASGAPLGAVFHGAVVERGGAGYLFTAKSGTGKTTHVRNWIRAFPDARIINGDKPILRIEGDRVVAYGTPWCGKEGWQTNAGVSLTGIAVLQRGDKNVVEPLAFGDAVGALVSQTYRADDDRGLLRTLRFVSALHGKVPLFRLACNMDVSSAQTAYLGMSPSD